MHGRERAKKNYMLLLVRRLFLGFSACLACLASSSKYWKEIRERRQQKNLKMNNFVCCCWFFHTKIQFSVRISEKIVVFCVWREKFSVLLQLQLLIISMIIIECSHLFCDQIFVWCKFNYIQYIEGWTMLLLGIILMLWRNVFFNRIMDFKVNCCLIELVFCLLNEIHNKFNDFSLGFFKFKNKFNKFFLNFSFWN